MPTSIRVSDLLGSFPYGAGQTSNSPYVVINGQYQQNPAYLNPLQEQQLATTVMGPTQGAIQGSAAQSAAQEAAKNAVAQYAPFSASDLGNLYAVNPSTGAPTQLPAGTTPAQVQGQTFLNSNQAQNLADINTVQNIIDQVKEASKAVNVSSEGQGIGVGNRNANQVIQALKLKATGDPNYQFLTEGVKGLLGEVASGALGVNRFNPEEIDAIMANIPTPYDTKQVANAKVSHLQSLLNIKKQQIIPQSIQQTNSQYSPSAQQQPNGGYSFGGQ